MVAAGITLHETLKAYDMLQVEGIAIRVIDAYSVKPIDAAGLWEAARATNYQVIVVEDHWLEGGLGDAVLEAFSSTPQEEEKGRIPAVTKLAVHRMPGSGTPARAAGSGWYRCSPHRCCRAQARSASMRSNGIISRIRRWLFTK